MSFSLILTGLLDDRRFASRRTSFVRPWQEGRGGEGRARQKRVEWVRSGREGKGPSLAALSHLQFHDVSVVLSPPVARVVRYDGSDELEVLLQVAHCAEVALAQHRSVRVLLLRLATMFTVGVQPGELELLPNEGSRAHVHAERPVRHRHASSKRRQGSLFSRTPVLVDDELSSSISNGASPFVLEPRCIQKERVQRECKFQVISVGTIFELRRLITLSGNFRKDRTTEERRGAFRRGRLALVPNASSRDSVSSKRTPCFSAPRARTYPFRVPQNTRTHAFYPNLAWVNKMAAPSITRSIPKERTFSEAKSKKDLKTLLDIVEPKLMVNRSIRSFLANYNVRQWQQVIKYLLVFGTATLQEKVS